MTEEKTLLIEVRDLHKSFGTLEVLKGIDENIYKGEVVVVIGPSGSGKSTFLRCLNRLEEPTSGHIIFEGADITDSKTDINKLRQKMGMVFQQFNLFNNLSVMDNILIGPTKVKGLSDEQARSIATRLLERVGLLDKSDAFPSQLSGGQTRRYEGAGGRRHAHGGGHARNGLCQGSGRPRSLHGRRRHPGAKCAV